MVRSITSIYIVLKSCLWKLETALILRLEILKKVSNDFQIFETSCVSGFWGRGVDRSSPLLATILVKKDGINEEKNQVNSPWMVNIVQGEH